MNELRREENGSEYFFLFFKMCIRLPQNVELHCLYIVWQTTLLVMSQFCSIMTINSETKSEHFRDEINRSGIDTLKKIGYHKLFAL